MSERQLSVEILSQRIDELLSVLGIISRDLSDILKDLKSLRSTDTVSYTKIPSRGSKTIEDVRLLFPPDLEEMLALKESEDTIIIKPRTYLASDDFAKIASIIRDAGGEYISAGKKSHFKISKQIE